MAEGKQNKELAPSKSQFYRMRAYQKIDQHMTRKALEAGVFPCMQVRRVLLPLLEKMK